LNKERALDAFVGSSTLLLFPLLVPTIFSSPSFSGKFLVGIESGIAIIGFLLLISVIPPWLLKKSSNADVSQQSSRIKLIEDGLLHVLFFALPFIPVALFFAIGQIVHAPLSLYIISNVGMILGGVAMVVTAFIALVRCKKRVYKQHWESDMFFSCHMPLNWTFCFSNERYAKQSSIAND